MAAESIKHDGVVTRVEDTYIIVCIENQSACSACHAKGACGLSEVVQKEITTERPAFPVAVGDSVCVMATMQHSLLSVLFAYIFPSILIIGLLATLIGTGINEISSALISLLIIAVYFFALYLLRGKFAQKIKFHVNVGRSQKTS